jgi:hypothetical protein
VAIGRVAPKAVRTDELIRLGVGLGGRQVGPRARILGWAQAPARPASRGLCRSVEALDDGHELSIRNAVDGAVRGQPPRSKISMRRMRPPQQGQGFADPSGASGSALVSGAGGGGVGSSALALARLATRAGLANRP